MFTEANVRLMQGVRLIWGPLNTGFTVSANKDSSVAQKWFLISKWLFQVKATDLKIDFFFFIFQSIITLEGLRETFLFPHMVKIYTFAIFHKFWPINCMANNPHLPILMLV